MRRQSQKYFSPLDKEKLLKYLEENIEMTLARRALFMYRLLFATGLRLAEMVSLNVADVQSKISLTIIGKGRKEREIPLSKKMQEEIRDFIIWKQTHGEQVDLKSPLIVSTKGGRLGTRGVQQDLDHWVRASGIDGKYSPHAFRHTVGFELMNKTKNIRQVQEFLGHSFVTTTQIYTHVTKDELRLCAELLSDDSARGNETDLSKKWVNQLTFVIQEVLKAVSEALKRDSAAGI